MNTQTTDKAIPLWLLNKNGHSSEEDLQKREPKVYKVVKAFANASDEDQDIFMKLMELLTSDDERMKDFIKGASSSTLWYAAKEIVKNGRSIDDFFVMGAEEFFNLEEQQRGAS